MRLLRVVFLVAFVAIGGKAVALAAGQGHLAAIAREQQVRTVVLPAHRGAILDRNGVAFAVAQDAKTVYATPYMLSDPLTAAKRLAATLHIKWRGVYRAIYDHKSGFAYVARQASPVLADKAVALGLPGVADYAEEKRVYPLGTAAAQVVGYAGTDGHGLAGIEYRYDAAAGRHGRPPGRRAGPGRPGAAGHAVGAAQGRSRRAPHARQRHPAHGRPRAGHHGAPVPRQGRHGDRREPQDRRDLRHLQRAAGERQPASGRRRPSRATRPSSTATSRARPSRWSRSPARCPTVS